MDFETSLATARAPLPAPDVRLGLFGPDSSFWRVNRHVLIFLGAGRAALLQLAHPWVAQAIADHSSTRADPIGRFQRTFARVFDMVYGDLEAALSAAREVHALHDSIVGRLPRATPAFAARSSYRANQSDALCWVHATLWDTAVLVFEMMVRPLRAAEKESYYSDSKQFAALFGLGPGQLPSDWELSPPIRAQNR